MKQLLIAFQFLTIIPLNVKGVVSEKEIAESTVFFPVIGIFQGMSILLTALLLLKVFPAEIVSVLIVLALIISNGGFHLDGLSDTFDALAIKSTGDKAEDREKRLSVMKDSTVGPAGVMAIVIMILLKSLFINNIFNASSLSTAYSLLFLMPVFSKWMMVPSMYHGRPARRDGLGFIFLSNVEVKSVIFSSLVTIFFCFLSAKAHLWWVYGIDGIRMLGMIFIVLYIFSLAAVKFCSRQFGGLTGDNLGAISEVSEIVFLMAASIWLQHLQYNA